MTAEDVQGQLFAAARQFDASAGFVSDESGIGQSLDHGGDGAGHDTHGIGKAAHGDEIAGGVLLLQIELLEVIFNGDAGHGDLRPIVPIPGSVDNFDVSLHNSLTNQNSMIER